MSYSFFNTCHNCKNKDACTDHVKVQQAINSIHEDCLSDKSGHMGSGEIIIQCQNHDQPPKK